MKQNEIPLLTNELFKLSGSKLNGWYLIAEKIISTEDLKLFNFLILEPGEYIHFHQGEIHHPSQVARVSQSDQLIVPYAMYYRYGKIHRIDGPAIFYNTRFNWNEEQSCFDIIEDSAATMVYSLENKLMKFKQFEQEKDLFLQKEFKKRKKDLVRRLKKIS